MKYTLILIGFALFIIISLAVGIYQAGYNAGFDFAAERNADGEVAYQNGYSEGYEDAIKAVRSELYQRYGKDANSILDW